jgi:protein-tyrosine phosphatase
MTPHRILFVCTGNICRSPTAEAMLRHKAAARGLADRVAVGSAGLEGWHAGEPPDKRSQAHARRRGCELSALRARRFTPGDFERHDWVVAMDAGHHAQLSALCPAAERHKLRRAADFAASVPASGVPDPYYGEASDFEQVLDMVEAICEGILAAVAARRA